MAALSVTALCLPGFLRIPAASAEEIAEAEPSLSVAAEESVESSSQTDLSASASTEDMDIVMSSADTAPANPATPTPTPGPIHQAVPTPLIFSDSEIYENETAGDAPADYTQAGTTAMTPSEGDAYYDPDDGVSGTYSEDTSDTFAYSPEGSRATAAVKTGRDPKSEKTHAVKTGPVKTADPSRILPEVSALGLSFTCLAVLLKKRRHRKQFQN